MVRCTQSLSTQPYMDPDPEDNLRSEIDTSYGKIADVLSTDALLSKSNHLGRSTGTPRFCPPLSPDASFFDSQVEDQLTAESADDMTLLMYAARAGSKMVFKSVTKWCRLILSPAEARSCHSVFVVSQLHISSAPSEISRSPAPPILVAAYKSKQTGSHLYHTAT